MMPQDQAAHCACPRSLRRQILFEPARHSGPLPVGVGPARTALLRRQGRGIQRRRLCLALLLDTGG